MRTLVLSDIHLGNRHSQVELVEQVLSEQPFDRLILNGDTIHSVNFRKLTLAEWRCLERFKKIGRERELVLIRGNHDHSWDYQPGQEPTTQLHTASLLPALLDVPMREEYLLDLQGRQYLVRHGDQFDPSMHHPMLTDTATFCYQMTSKLSKKIAKWLKKKSKSWTGLLDVVRKQAIAFAQQHNFAGIITGHTHFAEDLHSNEIHYINTGSWTEHPCSYVTISERQQIQVHFSED